MNHDKIKIEFVSPEKIISNNSVEYDSIIPLIKSITMHGLFQPIVVQKKANLYYLVSGNKRLAACKYSNISKIPVLIKSFSNYEADLVPLIKDFTSKQNSFIETAKKLKKFSTNWNLSVEEVAELLNLDDSAIENYLLLLKLTDKNIEYIENSQLSINQALLALRISDLKLREKFLYYINNEKFSEKQSALLLSKIMQNGNKQSVRSSLPNDIRLYTNSIKAIVNTMIKNGIDAELEFKNDELFNNYIVKIKN